MTDCPSFEMLRNLLEGDLPSDSASTIRIHLETCSSCLEVLDRHTDDPELDQWLVSGMGDSREPGSRSVKYRI